MILIVCALSAEARPIIGRLALTRNNSVKSHEFYENDGFALIVSGTGKLKAAIATTLILSKYAEKHDTIKIVNIGVCGSIRTFPIGEIAVINKVIDRATGRNYYPDMLLKHAFIEGSLETCDFIVNETNSGSLQCDFADMEAAGYFEAAMTFLKSSRIACLKIISDHLSSAQLKQIDKTFVINLFDRKLEQVVAYLDTLETLSSSPKVLLSVREEDLLKKITRQLKLTRYQTFELATLANSYKVRTKRELEVIEAFTDIKSKSKQEGKKFFEEIQRLLAE